MTSCRSSLAHLAAQNNIVTCAILRDDLCETIESSTFIGMIYSCGCMCIYYSCCCLHVGMGGSGVATGDALGVVDPTGEHPSTSPLEN